MNQRQSHSLMRDLTLAIVPLFFGVYLFAALLETYKDDMSSRKDLVLDFYRPMREAQAECRATQQQLVFAYGAQAGTFTLMLNELDHMVSADPATLTRDYEVLPRSIIQSNNMITAQIGELKTKLDGCTQTLYRKYEEVALATAAYDRFLEIEKQRDIAMRPPYAKRAALMDQLANRIRPASMMDTLRESLTSDSDRPDAKSAMKLKVHALGDPLTDLYRQMAQNEQDLFKVEQETDGQLIGLFAKEVSRRYERGLLRGLRPW